MFNGSRLLDRRGAGPVTVIQVSVAASFARRARIAFYVCLSAGVVVGMVLAAFADGRQRVVDVLVGVVVGALVGFVVSLVVRAWPVLRSIWHWVPEILVGVTVVVAWFALVEATTSWVPPLVLLALAGLVAVVGPVRRWVVRAWWCLLVRHRLRLVFGELLRNSGRVNPPGLPLILLTRPTPAGQRVWVWLRPGVDIGDLEGKTGKLAVACWASEVRIVRASRRFAALLRLDITRRDPLRINVASPLLSLIPTRFTPPVRVAQGRPPGGLDLPDVPEPPDEPDPGRRERKPRPVV